MGDFQGSPFDGFEEEQPQGQDGFMPEKPRQSNRGFMMAAGVIGAIILLAVIAMVVMFASNQSAGNPAEATSIAISTQNAITIQTATAQFIATNQAQVQKLELTLAAATRQSVPPTATATVVVANPTSVLALPTATVAPTNTGTAPTPSDPAARTATVESLLKTQAAQGTIVATPGGKGTPGLPATGFADEIGLPALMGAAFGLLLVIVLVRRARAIGH